MAKLVQVVFALFTVFLVAPFPMVADGHAGDGHQSVGAAPGCWSKPAPHVVEIDCMVGSATICGGPAQHAGWISTAAPAYGRDFVLAYDGHREPSEDPIQRYPGAMLRWHGSSDLVAAMPAVDSADGKSYLYVNIWEGGRSTDFRVPGVVNLSDDAHYEYRAAGNEYEVLVDGQRFATFRGGPVAGGYGGPGYLISCLATHQELRWENYGWRSVGATDRCWSTGPETVRAACDVPRTCGIAEQHAGWLDTTRTTPTSFQLSYAGRVETSTDALARYPGVILHWTSPGDFVSVTPLLDHATGESKLLVIQWIRGVVREMWVPALAPLAENATYTIKGVQNAYVMYVDGALFATFATLPARPGWTGPAFLHSCERQDLALEWTGFRVVAA